jgi:hypothetical protein
MTAVHRTATIYFDIRAIIFLYLDDGPGAPFHAMATVHGPQIAQHPMGKGQNIPRSQI